MSAEPGSLRWAVKESFLDYIGGLSDGAVRTFDGCEQVDGQFVFPRASTGDGGVHFSGGVHFTGFAGMLDVRLVDVMIEGEGAEQRLTALVGPASIAARATLAEIKDAPPLRPDEEWTATPRLTFEGVRIFGDVYQVGTELAPMFVSPEAP